MSYQDKVDGALALLREHNDAIGGEPQDFTRGRINPEEFITCIKASGGTTDDRLKAFSYEDILECLPSHNNVKPRIIAKELAKIFRGKEDVLLTESADKRPLNPRRVEQFSPRELVNVFDPEDVDGSVGQRLKAMSKGQPFVVFETGRKVDIASTLALLLEVKAGYDGRKDYEVAGQIKKVYRLGELPDNFADENPLYPNRPLRPDGTCDQTGRSWDGVSLEVRQLLRLALTKESVVLDIDKANDLIDIAISEDAETKVRKRYRKASVAFDEQPDERPKLKVSLASRGGGRPFDGGRKVQLDPIPNRPGGYVVRGR